MITDKNRFVYIIVIPKQEEKLFARSVFELLYIDKPKIFGNLYKVYCMKDLLLPTSTEIIEPALPQLLLAKAFSKCSPVKIGCYGSQIQPLQYIVTT